MKSYVTNPSFFRVKTLLSLEVSEVDSLARKAVGSLTSFRLLLGRCLLAMRETKGFKKYGCSSEIHYSVSRLGLSEGVAGDCRRVARDLLRLPDLTLAAEQGTIEWGKLREVSRKASPETEALWLKLCRDLKYKQIEKLVSTTPKGGVPGDVFEDNERPTTEFRCRMSEEVLAMLDRARRLYSLEQDKAVTTAEVLEWALASYISSQPVDEGLLEKVRVEMDKDVQAEKAREIPLVAHAREVAAEMSCIPIPGESEVEIEFARAGDCDQHDLDLTLALAGVDNSGYDDTASSESVPDDQIIARGGACGRHDRDLAHALARMDRSAYVDAASSGSNPDDQVFARAGYCDQHDFALTHAGLDSSIHDDADSCDSNPDDQIFARAGKFESDSLTVDDVAHRSCCGSRDQNNYCGQRQLNGLELSSARANSDNLEALKDTLTPIQNKRVCFNPRNRHATKAQKREVLRREGWCCATPGCPHKIWLHLHHLIPYSRGGPTLPQNLIGICSSCHSNVHNGTLKIFLDDQDKLVFTDPDGNCLAEQADLMLAGWLDFHEGWHGEREDSYRMRWGRGDWSVFEGAV